MQSSYINILKESMGWESKSGIPDVFLFGIGVGGGILEIFKIQHSVAMFTLQ